MRERITGIIFSSGAVLTAVGIVVHLLEVAGWVASGPFGLAAFGIGVALLILALELSI
jgi:hypothetical protein